MSDILATPLPQRAIFMSRPDQGPPPSNYVVVKTKTMCINCNTTHEQSTVTAKTWMHSRMTSKPFANQRPVRSPTEISYNLPIEIENRPIERIPFCHECFETISLSHLPLPPQVDVARVVSSTLTDSKPAKSPPKSKTPFTIDDL
jgi:hypothetical protein